MPLTVKYVGTEAYGCSGPNDDGGGGGNGGGGGGVGGGADDAAVGAAAEGWVVACGGERSCVACGHASACYGYDGPLRPPPQYEKEVVLHTYVLQGAMDATRATAGTAVLIYASIHSTSKKEVDRLSSISMEKEKTHSIMSPQRAADAKTSQLQLILTLIEAKNAVDILVTAACINPLHFKEGG
ncbi:hypothetical protein Pelo_8297 [Pelomyxa schiedti]|nr:hypothetical protein Pelo_8297 [Pelomyxa schiedti]